MVYVTPRVCIIIVVIINVMFVVLILFMVGQNAVFTNIIDIDILCWDRTGVG